MLKKPKGGVTLESEVKQPLTVKALTKYIKLKFDCDSNLQTLLLKGEISNFKRHSKGHLYFTLKDDEASISAVMFAGAAKHLAWEPRNGMEVIVKGYITVYEVGGTYSFHVKEINEDGIGNLYIAFNQLKERLTKEGLFDANHKQPLPKFPEAIGVITSPTGAAIRDILSTLKRRFPLAKVYLYPALVQGENAAPSIVACIEQANDHPLVDTLIVGRGGGSIEDLWAFNEEVVARAIFNSKIPIISAVGHETDFTIADFVADTRAPTPTAAAEMAVPNLPDVLKYLGQLNVRLNHNFTVQLTRKKDRLRGLQNHYMMKNPYALFEQRILRVNQLTDKLQYSLQQQLTKKKQPLDFLSLQLHQLISQKISNVRNEYTTSLVKLEALNPLGILKKGYMVLTDEKARTIKSVEQIHIGQRVCGVLDDGTFTAKIETKE